MPTMTSGGSKEAAMEIKAIKTEDDYRTALAALERLIDLDPDDGVEADRLEVLSILIEDYESKNFPIDLPDPIEAIKFCMEQQGKSQADLAPLIGSRSKVSEVLSRKRPLTLSMIRALHKGLSIPAEVLLNEQGASLEEGAEIDWRRFPLKEMIDLGWIDASWRQAKDRAEEILTEFLEPIGGLRQSPVFYRRSAHIRAARKMNDYALEAWRAQVQRLALEEEAHVADKPTPVDLDFMGDLARLSRGENGPLLAREYLKGHGIILLCVPHLSKTYLDGASTLTPSGKPVIALTLRYDRIDNFWFVLMHELAHVAKHLCAETPMFFDDLDPAGDIAPEEQEADRMAGEALIPEAKWRQSGACHLQSTHAAEELANELRIHPAIVAGKIRYETGNYRKLNQMVGHGRVGKLFES